MSIASKGKLIASYLFFRQKGPTGCYRQIGNIRRYLLQLEALKELVGFSSILEALSTWEDREGPADGVGCTTLKEFYQFIDSCDILFPKPRPWGGVVGNFNIQFPLLQNFFYASPNAIKCIFETYCILILPKCFMACLQVLNRLRGL